MAKGSYTSMGPYRCPAVRIVARSVLSHTVPSTAFRGFGNPQQIWAVESNMNEAARELGIDPLELRLRNLAGPGEEFIPGDTPADGDWAVAVRRAAEMIDWDSPKPPGRGRGIAVGLKSGPTTGLSYSTVRLLVDGSVVVYAGTSDMGQGARTIFAQIAADELGAPIEWVTVVSGDTTVVPYDQQTSASRSSVFMGTAVLRACQDIQAKVRSMAARLESIDESSITVERGEVRIGDRVLPIRDVVARGLGRLGGEIIGVGEMRKDAEPDHPLGGTAAFYEFNCTAVEVEVDRETGDISIPRYVTVSDVGKALNPLQVRGQDEGAAVMGLGHTLMEHYIWDDAGRIRNLGAIDYRIPTSMDLPLEMAERHRRERGRAGTVRREGHERGRVAAGRSGRRGGCARMRRARSSAICRCRRSASGGRCRRWRAGRVDAVSGSPTRSTSRTAETLDEAKALVGGKAANLGVMARELGAAGAAGVRDHDADLPDVPRRRLADGPRGRDPRGDGRRSRAQVGRRFGDPTDPLLVSVRSGAPVSMPGMMDTILDLGLNDDTTRGLGEVARDAAFAEECRRRFVESFRSIVGVQDVPEDPWTQLRLAIEAVFRSWQSDRARTYRQKEGIPDDLGTAVTVQAMVFGNRGSDSGTGVLFTRNPATGEPTLYGDVLFDAQGEDVVAGTHQTEPIAVLDTRLPAVARELRAAAERLEHHYADLCDIEFTIEDGKLWLLQVRVGKRSPQAALRIAVDMAEDEDFPLTREQAVRRVLPLLADPPRVDDGDAAGRRAADGWAGRVAGRRERADRHRPGRCARVCRGGDTGDPRPRARRRRTTSTAWPGPPASSRPGAGSPVTPRSSRAGGASLQSSALRASRSATARSGSTAGRCELGDVITIDGGTGEVFEGTVAGTTEVVPEVATLLGWAREAGVDVGDTATAPSPTAPSQASGEVDADRALRAISIKGFVTAGGSRGRGRGDAGRRPAGARWPRRRRPRRVDRGRVSAHGLPDKSAPVRSSRRSATRGVSRLRRRRSMPSSRSTIA